MNLAVLQCLNINKTQIGKQPPAGVAHSLNYGKLRKMNLAVLRCLNINKTQIGKQLPAGVARSYCTIFLYQKKPYFVKILLFFQKLIEKSLRK